MSDLLCKPEDELIHAPVGDESLPWKDTFYFSALDEERGTHCCMHMTVSGNRSPDTRIAVSLKHAGREHVAIRREDGTHTNTEIGNTLARIEPVHLSWDADHVVRWIATADEFSFDLTVTGVGLAPNFDALFPGANPTGEQGHLYHHCEQLIRVSGDVAWSDTERVRISGFGWRDRGWGRRKTELTFGTGYDLIGGILPDGTAFAMTAMRNVEHGPDAPLPAYGFHTDGATASPCVAGTWWKDSQSFPAKLDLEFASGYRVAGEQMRRASTLGTAFHDTEPEFLGIASGARDYYAVLADPGGREFGVFSNEGHTLRADVLKDAKFFHAEPA